jgi:tetratricopeptide (TPR) repeat protein
MSLSSISQNTVNLHREAMHLCDRALAAQKRGNRKSQLGLFRKAFEKEREAALSFQDALDDEPNRSVLLRSAASLALRAEEFREAERMTALALAGHPPAEIAEELYDLWDQIQFHRHLHVQGVRLTDADLQLTLTGDDVAPGFVNNREFIQRVNATEKLMIRTAERQMGLPYRDSGKANAEVSEYVRLYLSAPRAASFAVTLKLGLPERQLTFANMEFPVVYQPEKIIDEFLGCIDLFNQNENEALAERIHDDAYYRNFVGLAELLAPDGARVRTVGLTVVRPLGETIVALRRTPQSFVRASEHERPPEEVVVTGVLNFADGRREKGKISIEDDGGARHPVIVPPGLMDDIVKPLWKERVSIRGVRGARGVELSQIQRAE